MIDPKTTTCLKSSMVSLTCHRSLSLPFTELSTFEVDSVGWLVSALWCLLSAGRSSPDVVHRGRAVFGEQRVVSSERRAADQRAAPSPLA